MAFRIAHQTHEPVEVEKRKHLTPRQKAQVCLDQNGKCAGCADKLRDGCIEYDHVIPLAIGGSQELDNWQALCSVCHAEKTKGDVADIAKAKRRAGETGQRKRRKQRGHGLIMSRGFDKSLSKKMNGEVVRKD